MSGSTKTPALEGTFTNNDYEHIWIKLIIRERIIIIGCIYYPPDGNIDSEIADLILNMRQLSENQFPGCYFLTGGDFNSFDESLLLNFSDLELIPSAPTRENKTLDKIFINHSGLYKEAQVIETYLKFDHKGVLCEPTQPHTERCFRTFRETKFRNKQQLGLFLDSIDILEATNATDPNSSYENLQNLIMEALDQTCPLKKVKLSDRDPPFMTPYLKSLLKKKYQLKRRNRSSVNLEEEIKNEIKKNLTRGKRGTALWWKEINTLAGRTKSKSTIKHNAHELNDFFANICTTENYRKPEQKSTASEEVSEITIQQVYDELRNLKRTTTGPDGIPSWLLKDNAHNFAEPLAVIFNASIKQALVPAIFKMARIVPIPKTSEPKNFGDYRPVSITSIVSRIFEKIVMKRFVSSQYNTWLPSNQHGFRNGASTTTAILELQNHVASSEEKHFDYMRILSVDLSKAFDSVQHNLIVEKLSKVDPPINNYIINWISNFLTDRQIYTQFEAQTSDLRLINQGVPQGTVLGPPLFNTSAFDMNVNTIPNAEITKFADDSNCTISCTTDNDNTLVALDSLKRWCGENRFTLNESKTKVLTVKFKRREFSLLKHEEIAKVDEMKVLGFILDNKLSFKSHVLQSCKKASSICYLLVRLKNLGFTPEVLTLLYKSLVLSILTYGLPVWGGAPISTLQNIDKVQKRAMNLGIIKRFTPIKRLIEENDMQLLQKIKSPDHILHHLLPTRSEYADGRLRTRETSSNFKLEKNMKLFPHRALRKLSFK